MMRQRTGWVFLSGALLTGCFSPNYESGKTACSPVGECPPGFECIQAICYRPGTGPIDMNAPFDSAPDLTPVITSQPPAAVYVCGGGGGSTIGSGRRSLGVSVGGTIVKGGATASSGASMTFGYFSSSSY